ncbi:transmembrane protein 128-like [Asterias rubens]|uniref:transmembrane protein 128-like n=1 Tax=Asterias rubens TaxID=7604 RepID=UPI0014554F74|nr:transmembrane protein 128-like [Asterias rubens]
MTQSTNRVRMSENNSQTDSQEETSSRIPEREEDEFQLRRRRIADVFMAAYGRDLKNIDPKRLVDLQKLRDGEELETNTKPSSPYNLQTLLWILATAAILYYTDLIPAIKEDHRIYRSWLYLGLVLLAIPVCIGGYLIVFLSWIKKNSDWENAVPMAIPLATGTFIAGSICLNIAIWPVYSILTPVMLFTLFMGFIVVVSLLPNIF